MVDILGHVRCFLRLGVFHWNTDVSDSVLFLFEGKQYIKCMRYFVTQKFDP